MNNSPDRYFRRSAEIVAECAELDTEIARLQSRQARLLAERVELLLDEVPTGAAGFDQAERSMICEVSAGLRLTRFAAARSLANAHTLHERLPATREAFEAGELSAAHVDVIAEAVRDIPMGESDAVRAFEREVVPYAKRETRARTKAFADSMVAAVAPVPLLERQRRVHDERAVSVRAEGDGSATLRVTGPSALVHAAFDLITQEGHAILQAAKSADEIPLLGGDKRRLDQVRFDRIMLRILTGTIGDDADIIASIHPTVQVTIAASTLLGLDERLAELDAHGPMDPELASMFAASVGSWQRLVIDAHGMVTQVSTYQPTEAMRRYLRARDRHCRFPGCRHSARRSQIDHNLDHGKGGPTDVGNGASY
ncbi:HNH endonuclease signature motif containing protein [Microbacterium panaciterrae]|uniref:DUF222 domain-containing protein n=1 Tax=Microbacterium panaciterrae TaxID=985759 RepID=A0ABP8PCR5_9MICO